MEAAVAFVIEVGALRGAELVDTATGILTVYADDPLI
jgi:hypothetical protein